MGWRYLLFTLGGCTLLLWGLRFFIFTLEESPRFLAGRGQDTEAVAVVQRLAAYNGRTSTLTVEQLTKAAEAARERTLKADQLTGSTFTISNFGSMGGRFGTPIINYPEAGILAIGRAREGVVVHVAVSLDLALDLQGRDGPALGHQERDQGELADQLVSVVRHRPYSTRDGPVVQPGLRIGAHSSEDLGDADRTRSTPVTSET